MEGVFTAFRSIARPMRFTAGRNQIGLTERQIAYCVETWAVLGASRSVAFDTSEAVQYASRTRFDETHNTEEKPMHKVEPSGVIMHGICDIQTEYCTATAGGAITAVWGPPGRTQINVCRARLEEKMRRGEWVVEGARLRQPV
jgi:hypothetical protein